MNSLEVNQGFPAVPVTMKPSDLQPGTVVDVLFSDAPIPVPALITNVEPHAHNYKGERDCTVIYYYGKVLVEQTITHTQIKSFSTNAFKKFLTGSED